MEVSNDVVFSILIDYVSSFRNEKNEIPNFLFSKITSIDGAKTYFLLQSFLECSFIFAKKHACVATRSICFDIIVLASENGRKVVHMLM
jgi:hypothetical protein